MVPKLHAKGSSFKGVAAYLFHDKGRAETQERVEWIETRNLATRDGKVGWKVMAATAIDAERLKHKAGVKNTGRKSKDVVLHFTLSWHPEEKKGLTRDEMRRAALGAIRALGADDRQAMLICHNDEKHPHLHVVVNRVSAEDGRMLSSSKEKLNLSRWAEEYEKGRGQILCEQRAINNNARKRNEYTRGKKDRARNIYEMMPSNDNSAKVKPEADEQRKKAAAIAKQQRATQKRHQQEWETLENRHRQRQTEVKESTKRRAEAAIDRVRKEYRQAWEFLFNEDHAERREFEQRENKLLGRVQNALRSIDFGAIIQGRDRRKAISEAFQSFADAGKRLEGLKAQQDRRAKELLSRQRRTEQEAVKPIRSECAAILQKNRNLFAQERGDLILTQSMDGARIRAEWKTNNEQRITAWENTKRETLSLKPIDPVKLAEARKLMEKIKSRPSSAGRADERDRERGE